MFNAFGVMLPPRRPEGQPWRGSITPSPEPAGSASPSLVALNYANAAAFVCYLFVLVSILPSSEGLQGPPGTQSLVLAHDWVFSIWGAIYTLLGIFAFYQLLPAVRGTEVVRQGVGWLFVVQCVAGVLWASCLYRNMVVVNVLSVSVMWLSALVLVVSVHRYRLPGKRDEARSWPPGRPLCTYTAIAAGFSLNLGWLTAALLIHVAQAVGMGGRAGVIAYTATALMTMALGGFVGSVLLVPGEAPFTLALAWTAIGVAVLDLDPPASVLAFGDRELSRGFGAAFAVLGAACLCFAGYGAWRDARACDREAGRGYRLGTGERRAFASLGAYHYGANI